MVDVLTRFVFETDLEQINAVTKRVNALASATAKVRDENKSTLGSVEQLALQYARLERLFLRATSPEKAVALNRELQKVKAELIAISNVPKPLSLNQIATATAKVRAEQVKQLGVIEQLEVRYARLLRQQKQATQERLPSINRALATTRQDITAARGVGVAGVDTSGLFNEIAPNSVATATQLIKLYGAAAVGALGAVTALIAAYKTLQTAIPLAAAEETRKLFLETFLQSTVKARGLREQINQLAVEAGSFTKVELEQLVQQLLAWGRSSEVVIEDARILGDIAAGVGRDKLPQLTLAFGQIATAGRLTGAELRQLTEAGVPALELIAKVSGRSAQQIKEDMENGVAPSFELVRKALKATTEEGGKFFNLNAKLTDTLSGSFNKFTDVATLSGIALGERFLPAAKATVKTATELVSELGEYIKIPLSEKIEREKNDLNALVGALNFVTEGSDQYKTILGEIVNLYPEFLNGIDATTVGYTQLKKILEEVNKQYDRQIELQLIQEERDANRDELLDAKRIERELLKDIDLLSAQIGIDAKNTTLPQISKILDDQRKLRRFKEFGLTGTYAALNKAIFEYYAIQKEIAKYTAIQTNLDLEASGVKAKQIRDLEEQIKFTELLLSQAKDLKDADDIREQEARLASLKSQKEALVGIKKTLETPLKNGGFLSTKGEGETDDGLAKLAKRRAEILADTNADEKRNAAEFDRLQKEAVLKGVDAIRNKYKSELEAEILAINEKEDKIRAERIKAGGKDVEVFNADIGAGFERLRQQARDKSALLEAKDIEEFNQKKIELLEKYQQEAIDAELNALSDLLSVDADAYAERLKLADLAYQRDLVNIKNYGKERAKQLETDHNNQLLDQSGYNAATDALANEQRLRVRIAEVRHNKELLAIQKDLEAERERIRQLAFDSELSDIDRNEAILERQIRITSGAKVATKFKEGFELQRNQLIFDKQRILAQRQNALDEIGILSSKRLRATKEERAEYDERINELEAFIAEQNNLLAKNGNEQEDLERDRINQIVSAYISAYSEISGQIFSALDDAAQREEEYVNRSIELQRYRVEKALELARYGNTQALEDEEKRLNALEKQKQEAAKRQKRLDDQQRVQSLLVAVANMIASAALVPFPASLGAISTGIGAILGAFLTSKNKIQGFNKGTTRVTGGSGVRDDVPALLTAGEGVFPRKTMEDYNPILTKIFHRQISPKDANRIGELPSLLIGVGKSHYNKEQARQERIKKQQLPPPIDYARLGEEVAKAFRRSNSRFG
jgi:tape measure domain-containing protein